MHPDKLKISTTTDGEPPAPGCETAAAPKPINPATGQHGSYWVLNEDERKKGFIRPVRRTYCHVGSSVCGKQDCDGVRLGGPRDICVMPLGHDGEHFIVTQTVTQVEAQRAEEQHVLGGCGCNTSMGLALAETWARDIHYYGSTFCCNCGVHLPVEEFVWVDDPGTGRPTEERLGT